MFFCLAFKEQDDDRNLVLIIKLSMILTYKKITADYISLEIINWKFEEA